jgi:hypothetical protein
LRCLAIAPRIRSQVDSARCQQANSSAQRVSTFKPRARSGSSPLRQIARAPLGQETRRFDGSKRGTHHGGATVIRPEGPSTMTSRMSAAVGAIKQPSFMTAVWARSWTQHAPARVLPAPRPATYAQTRQSPAGGR